MLLNSEETALLVRYLLDDLPDEERASIEQRYFQDDEYFLEVSALEEELIRDYLRSALPPSQSLLFENRYLRSPEFHKRVEFTRLLMQAASSLPGVPLPREKPWGRLLRALTEPPNGALRVAMAGAVMVAICGWVWVGVENMELQRRIEKLEGQRLALEAPVERGPVAVSFALSPGLVRAGGAARRLLVPVNAEVVRLQLDLDTSASAPAWRAVLSTPEGIEVWSGDAPAPGPFGTGRAAVVSIPAQQLLPGDYVLALMADLPSGLETVESYSFSVVRR